MPETETITCRCLACGKEYTDTWSKDEDRERTCPDPDCRSNSIRVIRAKDKSEG
jgi:hypothetical protein